MFAVTKKEHARFRKVLRHLPPDSVFQHGFMILGEVLELSGLTRQQGEALLQEDEQRSPQSFETAEIHEGLPLTAVAERARIRPSTAPDTSYDASHDAPKTAAKLLSLCVMQVTRLVSTFSKRSKPTQCKACLAAPSPRVCVCSDREVLHEQLSLVPAEILEQVFNGVKASGRLNNATLHILLTPTMRTCDLSGTFFGSGPLRRMLQECSNMSVLNLSNCRGVVSDNVLRCITRKMRSLSRLSIASCEYVTDDGVQSVKCLGLLVFLDVRGLPLLTSKCVRDLHRHFKALEGDVDIELLWGDAPASSKEKRRKSRNYYYQGFPRAQRYRVRQAPRIHAPYVPPSPPMPRGVGTLYCMIRTMTAIAIVTGFIGFASVVWGAM